jgi:hypothetical protein
LKLEPAAEKLRRYKSNWLQHVTRMNYNRMPKIMLNYRPNGRRRFGRPLKRLDEDETGLLRRNSWWMMMAAAAAAATTTTTNNSSQL